MNIIILGAGTFGTAIGNELSLNTLNNVILLSSNNNKVNEINHLHTNKSCFPNKHLSKRLKATLNKDVVKDADIIFIALPSSVILEYLLQLRPFFHENLLLVNLSKGLLKDGVTIVENIQDTLDIENVVSLKGPSFAVEIMEHADTLLTLGYKKDKHYKLIKQIIKQTALHIEPTNDIRGIELLSVLKNIYALVIGVIDAKYNSPNTRFMILTKAFSEIRIILKILHGKEDSLFLYSLFGDFCLTSLNDLSRNRTLVLLIGKGFFNSDYKSNSVILEGLNAIEILHDKINQKSENELPIFYKLYQFFHNKDKNLEFKFDELIK